MTRNRPLTRNDEALIVTQNHRSEGSILFYEIKMEPFTELVSCNIWALLIVAPNR